MIFHDKTGELLGRTYIPPDKSVGGLAMPSYMSGRSWLTEIYSAKDLADFEVSRR